MPATSSEGRRAAQASAAPMDNDQAERDANLKKVQARDLVEFGMIPVSTYSFELSSNCQELDNNSLFLPGIRRTFPCFSSVPFIRRGHACENIDRTEKRFGASVSCTVGYGSGRTVVHVRSSSSDRQTSDGKTNWCSRFESYHGKIKAY